MPLKVKNIMANKAYPPSICPGIPRLGKCPTGWSTCTFGDILTVVERPVPVDDDTVYQLVTAKRNRGGIVPREQLKGREIKTQGQYTVRAGDFLIANRQIIHGACGIVPESLDGALVSGEYTVLLPKDRLYLPWLACYAHSVHFQQTCFQSSIGVDVEKMVFKLDWWLKQRLHVPPMSEQKKIAAILSTWDAAIGQTRDLIKTAKRRKLALMQQLLTGNVRLPGFGDAGGDAGRKTHGTTGGRLPEGWRRLHLHALARLEYGRDWASVADPAGAFPVYGTGGIIGRSSEPLAHGPTLIIGRKGSIAQPQMVESSFWAVDTTFYLVPKVAFSVGWLHALLCLSGLGHLSEGSGVPSLSRSTLESVRLPTPPLTEQRAIAAVLTTADDEIRELEAKAEALERQKKGLMQKLLTGEVRVTQDAGRRTHAS